MELDDLLPPALDLLAIPSTADRPDELHRALELVLDFVGPGFHVERFSSGGKPSALVSTAPGARDFRVLLNAHLDVVPGAPEQFRPRRVGDRLHARGAQDMKLSALVLASVFRDLARALPYPLGLQLVTDEEVGGRDGTRHQLDEGVRAGFVIIGEHSGLRVVTESKGIAGVRLVARGRSAHGAYPWLGDNALLRVLDAVRAVLAEHPVPTAERWRTTVNVARVDTPGTALNQVPDEAVAWLDVRFPAHEADAVSRLPLLCPDVEVLVDHVEPPHRVEPDDPRVLALREAALGQGYAGEPLRKHGAADARFFHHRGVDAVIFGVGGDGQHGPDEHADLTTVVPYRRALEAFLRSQG
ncbi:M20 family metallopeptidase [Actinosynnema pretiosum]|uniref:Peptidase M20 n=1 Tax=Actinosynnema pretiosum TaxID=42197 RepID=A0A290Z4U5_9PSEU|nr:M20/M25/M40 family metallo-hydrolase [Actinosynnema pretiosum]ATE54018.1 peptidase M20 [Actinosynnema pretiosum]